MDQPERERLESKGWTIGTIANFWALAPDETVLVEMKLALTRKLKKRRRKIR